MISRKPCKWCNSVWHSKNKCPERVSEPLPEGFLQKRTNTLLSTQKPSERLKMPYKGKSERSQLTGLADKYHSAYIRNRGSDGTWNWCYTCGVQVPLDEIQNGHFISRRYVNTRWNDINCNPQCNECNVLKGGNLKVYEQKLRAQYGDDTINGLKRLALSGGLFKQSDIQAIIDEYMQ